MDFSTFELNNLMPGEYCFTAYPLDQNICCEVYDCITLTAECPEIILPDFEIFTNNCKGSNIFIQHDFDDQPTGGEPPYTWEWNAENQIPQGNGNQFQFDDSADAFGLLKDGVFRLTVTDANGCSAIQTFTNPEPSNMPTLLGAEFAEHSCSNPRELRFTIDFIIPENSDPSVKYGYSWRGFKSDIDEPAIYNEVEIENSGIGQLNINLFDSEISDDFIQINLYQKSNGSISCRTSSMVFEVPDFPSSTTGSTLDIVKISDEECELNNATYMLVGECNSEYGCNIIGDIQHINGEHVPPGHFNIDLGSVFGARSFTLNPLLSDGSFCGPINTMMYADHVHSLLVLGDEVWKKGVGCNCWDFTINSNQGVNPADYTIETPADDKFESFSVQTSNDDIVASICIEESGLYCIDVVDQYGCVTQHCKQLDIKDLESTTTIFPDATCSPEPDGSLTVNVNGGIPPYNFTYHDGLEEYLVYEGHAFVVFDNMPPGDYKFSFTDARGCSGGQDIVKVEECVSNQINTDFNVYHDLESNEFYVLGIDVDHARPPEESVEISWTGPNGFTESGPTISPNATGLYCFSAKPCCGGPYTGCRAFLNPIDCPFDQLPMSVENSCANNNVLNPKRIGIDPQPFARALGELLPLDIKNVRVEIILQSEDGGSEVERTIFDETTVRNDFSDRLHFVNTTQGSTLGPSTNQYNLEPSERDNLTVLVKVSIEGVELCGQSLPVNLSLDETCRQCEVVPFNEAPHFETTLQGIALGDYFTSGELDGSQVSAGCECFEVCSNLEDTGADECGEITNLRLVNIRNNTSPCAVTSELEIWCGEKRLEGEIIPSSTQHYTPGFSYSEGDEGVVGAFSYNIDDVPNDPDILGNCIYQCGCYFEMEMETGEIQQLFVPTEVSQPCPPEVDCVLEIEQENGTLCLSGEDRDSYYDFTVLTDAECSAVTSNDNNGTTPEVPSCPVNIPCNGGSVSFESIPEFQYNSIGSGIQCVYEIGCYFSDTDIFIPNGPTVVEPVNQIVDPNDPGAFPPFENTCIYKNSAGETEVYTQCNTSCHKFVGIIPSKTVAFNALISAGWSNCLPGQMAEPSGTCTETFVNDDDPPAIEEDSKTITYSEEYEGPPASFGEEVPNTFYTTGKGSNGSSNYFYMKSNHVTCNPTSQFDNCDFNSVFWTTKLNYNGEGMLCGSSNIFWRSGWCACPNEPNMTFNVGWLDGWMGS